MSGKKNHVFDIGSNPYYFSHNLPFQISSPYQVSILSPSLSPNLIPQTVLAVSLVPVATSQNLPSSKPAQQKLQWLN